MAVNVEQSTPQIVQETPPVVRRTETPGWQPQSWTLQIMPATLFLLVFLVGPVTVFFIYSFWAVEGYDLAPTWTLENYREALGDEIYRSLFAQTLRTAATAAVVTTVIAY